MLEHPEVWSYIVRVSITQTSPLEADSAHLLDISWFGSHEGASDLRVRDIIGL